MKLTLSHIDALQELVNIGVGRAAGVLNDMLASPIQLHIPEVRLLTPEELKRELKTQFNDGLLATVQLSFTGSFSGTAELVFPTESAANLVSVLTGEEPGTPDLDVVKIGALLEVGNIVLNGIMGSLSNALIEHLDYSLPAYSESKVSNFPIFAGIDENTRILLAHTCFIIEQLHISGDIILMFTIGSLDALLKAIDLAFGEAL
ncbi:chemotaxis protein CheC [Aerosakkonemataceae cyanobacterium BLCC-F154]|uniref:Chemotaxis protein CheC n=1 Tax=Floridaenema fluviatile BLCC-F154 TaxID=3153640 RepID=A0ABV4Y8A9_9CYAN